MRPRRAVLALAPPVVLGGCGLFGGSRRAAGPPPEESTPAHRACRAEARVAPEVRVLDRQANPMPGASFDDGRVAREKAVAENRAYRDCLRRAGLGLPGGVEAIVPR